MSIDNCGLLTLTGARRKQDILRFHVGEVYRGVRCDERGWTGAGSRGTRQLATCREMVPDTGSCPPELGDDECHELRWNGYMASGNRENTRFPPAEQCEGVR